MTKHIYLYPVVSQNDFILGKYINEIIHRPIHGYMNFPLDILEFLRNKEEVPTEFEIVEHLIIKR